jgi:HAD superfamily hydrolase (TIGR01493 family)
LKGFKATRCVSFDMDGTLIDSAFTDWVWGHGIPSLYAEKSNISFDAAKECVQSEYRKVGEGQIEWYDIKYWFRFFQFDADWLQMMNRYVDHIRVYPDVRNVLDRLKGRFPLVLTSNAASEFIDIELEATGLRPYFDRVFSATSEFREVKKTARVYQRICEVLAVPPADVVHVGDHYEFDYVVPKAVGISAFFLDRSARRRGDFVLESLSDLEERALAGAAGTAQG